MTVPTQLQYISFFSQTIRDLQFQIQLIEPLHLRIVIPPFYKLKNNYFVFQNKEQHRR